LADGQQLLLARGGEPIAAQPLPHLIGAIKAPASSQSHQFIAREATAEVARRLLPGLRMEGLGIEQEPIEIEQAGGGADHLPILIQSPIAAAALQRCGLAFFLA
jgi:hypothetical protein